jgi:hypothetical protein
VCIPLLVCGECELLVLSEILQLAMDPPSVPRLLVFKVPPRLDLNFIALELAIDGFLGSISTLISGDGSLLGFRWHFSSHDFICFISFSILSIMSYP